MNSDSVDITADSKDPQSEAAPNFFDSAFYRHGRNITLWAVNRLFMAAGELTAILLGGGIIWFGLLTSLMAKGEADVSFLKRNFSLWFAQAYEGQDAEIDTFKVQWHPGRASIGLLAKDILVKDAAGESLLTVRSIYVESDVNALWNKGFGARRLDLEGGQFTIKRDSSGAILGAIGEPKNFGRLGPVIPIASARSEGDEPDSIDAVSLEGTNVFIRDEPLGLALDLKDVNFDTNISETQIMAEGQAELILGEALTDKDAQGLTPQISVLIKRERLADKALDVNVEVSDFNPVYLQVDSDLFAPLNHIDIALNIELNWRDVEDKTRQILFDVTQSENRNTAQIYDFKGVENVSLSGGFDLLNDSLSLEAFRFSSPRIDVKGQADLAGIMAQQDDALAPVEFDLRLDTANWMADGVLSQPLKVKQGQLSGRYNQSTSAVSLSNIYLPIDQYIVKAQGDWVNILGANEAGQRSLKLKGEFDGTLSEHDLLALWPENFILGGRNWVKSSIVAASLSEMNFDIDISDFSKLEGGLPDDAVRLDFRVSDGLVQYIRTMTPLDNANGFGQLRANSIDLTLNSGNVGRMTIDKGRVDIPQFFPFGNDFTIEFEGRGPADYMVELIDQKPFEYASLYNLKPQDFSGQAYAKMKITRPLREFFDQKLIRYDVEVRGEEVSAPFGFGDYKLTNGGLFLTADKTGMTIKGAAQIGPLPVDINWRETFDFGATPTQLTLISRIDSAALDKFGVSLREYFGGDIPFTLTAQGQGIAFDTARITADLYNSEWVLADLWSKSKGQAGTIDLSITRQTDGQIVVDDFQASAPGLIANGALRLAPNMRLLEASLGRVFIDDFIDARVTLARERAEAPLQATLSGDYLNLEGFIGPTIWQSGSGVSLPLTLSANLNVLRLAPGYEISKANLVYNHSGAVIDQFRFSGGSKDGPVSLDLRRLEDGPFSSQLTFDLANASDIVSAFFNLDNIRGGRLYGEAIRPRNGDDLLWSGTVNVDDFTLINAPFLAQILSLASLNGLGDVLSGDGLNFETVEVPFTWGNGVLGLESARAAGPALGLTGDGQINVADKIIDVDGTLILAYAANSILGSIPILGDILGGNSDNATLGLTYRVNGSFEQAQVGVNPLSALTPGVLRQIFKPEREKRRVEIPSDSKEETKTKEP